MDSQIENTRYCLLKGHEENRASYISIYKGGQQTKQWLCVDCILKYFDNHGQPKTNHDMRQKLFLYFIKQQSKPIYYQSKELKKLIPIWIKRLQQFIQSPQPKPIYQNKESKKQIQIYKKKLQQFIKSTSFLIQQLQEEMKTIQEIEEIINLTKKYHNLFTNEQIDKIINLNNCSKKKYHSLSSDIQVIQDFVDLQYYNNKQQNKIFKNRKYYIQEIDETTYTYFGSSISKNEKCLAYGGSEKFLKIYGINQRKIIKEIKLDRCINVCQFTQDSSQLYVGLDGGYAIGYDAQDDFKEIYQQQIHSSYIFNIITIQNKYLITCSGDKSILKTDIKSKQQIFKLTGHTNYIMAIDYNDKDEIIVSGSMDHSIKLWNCRNQSIIINKEQSHNNDIRQIQLINNYQNVLSLDYGGNLYIWEIDLKKKDFLKLYLFSDQKKIFNFYQINQDQNLLLICDNYAKILNQQGETINTIEHEDKGSKLNLIIINLTFNYIQMDKTGLVDNWTIQSLFQQRPRVINIISVEHMNLARAQD